MTNKTTPIDTAMKQLDVRALARMLTEIAEMSQSLAAFVAKMPRANFDRVRKFGKFGRMDISGLEIAVIETLFATASGIAVSAQLSERGMRLGENGAGVRAHDAVHSAKAQAELSDLDVLAIGSLQVQILIYEAEEGTLEQRPARLLRAHRIAQSLVDDAMRAFVLEETADDAERIVALRLLANALFVAWEVDEAEGVADGSGARVRATLKDLRDPALYRQTGHLAEKLLDPRLAYQIADVAAMNGDFYASARLLKVAIRITDQDPSHPRAWKAAWLHTHPTEERHFDEVLTILESPLFR